MKTFSNTTSGFYNKDNLTQLQKSFGHAYNQ